MNKEWQQDLTNMISIIRFLCYKYIYIHIQNITLKYYSILHQKRLRLYIIYTNKQAPRKKKRKQETHTPHPLTFPF